MNCKCSSNYSNESNNECNDDFQVYVCFECEDECPGQSDCQKLLKFKLEQEDESKALNQKIKDCCEGDCDEDFCCSKN